MMMDSASHSTSMLVATRDELDRPFCVVCGCARDDLVVRKSGLKCPHCVGKSASKRYVKRQKLKPTQQCPTSMPNSAVNLTADGSMSLRYPAPLTSSASSSLMPPTEDFSSTFGSSARSSAVRPIEEYISGTSVFRAVVQQARHSKGSDDGSSKAVESATELALESTRNSNISSPPVDEHRTPLSAPAVPSHRSSGEGPIMAATYNGVFSPPPVPRTRASIVTPPTSTKAGDNEEALDDRTLRRAASAADAAAGTMLPPSRLPPRRTPCSHGGSTSSPTEGAGNGSMTTPVPAPGTPPTTAASADGCGEVAAAPSQEAVNAAVAATAAEIISHNKRGSFTSASLGINAGSVTVRCVEDEETFSEGFNGTFRDGQLPPMDAMSDPYASNPSTPRDDVSSSALSLSQQQQRQQKRQRRRARNASASGAHASSRSPSMSTDTAPWHPPAPRAGSRAGSSSSSVVERRLPARPNAQLPPSSSHVVSGGAGGSQVAPSSCSGSVAVMATGGALHTRNDSCFTQRSSTAASAAAAPTAPHNERSFRQGDPLDSCSEASSLCRMPHHAAGPLGVASSGRTGNQCAADDNTFSSSSMTTSERSAPASVPSSPSSSRSASPSESTEEAAAAREAKALRRRKTARRNGDVVPMIDATRVDDTDPLSTAHAEPASLPVVVTNLDGLHLTVELIRRASPAASPELEPRSLDDGSVDSNSTSLSNSYLHSGSQSTHDGYQRQVATGGQSGAFTVTRHIRQRSSGGGDGHGGSGAASRKRTGTKAVADAAVSSGQLEVRKLAYRIVLHDRQTGAVLLTQSRRLYTHIIPALEKVKMIAGSALPACPNKRLPSLRFATDAFSEERRSEVEALLQAIEKSPFYIRHPDMLKLLGLEASGVNGGAVAVTTTSSTDARSSGPGSSKCSASSHTSNTSGAMKSKGQRIALTSGGAAADGNSNGMRRAENAAAAPTASATSPVVSHGHPHHASLTALRRSDEGAAAASPGKEDGGAASNGTASMSATTAYLNSEALDAYRLSSADGGAGAAYNANPSNAFCRTPSQSSVQTSRSSVVRRHKLDEVTMEDLEHIQLGNLIGRGTFGSVYLGLLQTRRGPLMVAVKVMTVSEEVPPEEMASLQRELDVLCAARHKNIIRFLGSSLNTTTRDLRVFTEYVECGTIRSLVERFGALTMLAIQQYMQQILHGLQYLHGLTIAHRDIKGENILVTKNGRVKLSDFGSSTGAPRDAAVVAAAAASEEETNGGAGPAAGAGDMPVGSPQYMAPEVIQGSVTTPLAADIWSLGCVGIEMLDRPIWKENPNANPFVFLFRISRAGTPPQGLPTEEELATFQQSGRLGEYEGFKVYRDFLLQCLQVDPTKRMTAAELLKHPFMTYLYSKHMRWLPPSAKKAGAADRPAPSTV